MAYRHAVGRQDTDAAQVVSELESSIVPQAPAPPAAQPQQSIQGKQPSKYSVKASAPSWEVWNLSATHRWQRCQGWCKSIMGRSPWQHTTITPCAAMLTVAVP
jgi:hypothetical protein